MKHESFVVKFAKNLAGHVVSVDNGKVIVHCLGWHELIITPRKGEEADVLRKKILKAIAGKAADINAVEKIVKKLG